MRIVVSCHPTQGGSGIVATEIAQGLARKGHEIHLASCSRPFRLDEHSGVVFHCVNVPDYPLFRYPPHDLSLANKLAGVVKRFGIEIIHAHYAIPHSVAALLARAIVAPHKVRIVTTLHGTDITLVGSHSDFFDLTRYAMMNSDAVTAVSAWLSRETVRVFSLPRPPRVIHNFVDVQRFDPSSRAPYPEDGQPFHLVHASNLRPVKRVCDVVRVFEQVQRRLPARLTIVGDGPQKGLASEFASELQIGHKVDFVGTVGDMAAVLRSAHLFLLLSDYESFGLSALEAMACGTPVIATNRGGLAEVVEDGRTGLLCPVGDVGRIADEAVALLSDRARWEAMSEAARRRACEKFAAEKILPLYEDLYRHVLSG